MRSPLRIGVVVCLVGALHPAAARADTPNVPVDYTPPAPTEATSPTAQAGAQAAVEATPATGLTSTRCVAFIAAGVAVVGVGVGTAFGVLALDKKSDFEAHPTVAGANTGNQEAVLADVAFGTAVIAGVTSLVLFLKHDQPDDATVTTGSPSHPGDAPTKPASSVSFTVSPILSPHGGGAGAVLRF